MIIIDAFIAYLGALPVAIHVVQLLDDFVSRVYARDRVLTVCTSNQRVKENAKEYYIHIGSVCVAATDEKQQQKKK